MRKTSKILALSLFFGSLSCYAAPPLTQGDLEAARQSFAIEAALEGCWIRKETPVACGDKAEAGSKCISIEVKKVPCADEKKPEAEEKKGNV